MVDQSNVYAALAAVQAELGGIDKTERNTQQNFNFRSIDAITAVVRPLFGRHGLTTVPQVESVEYEDVVSSNNKSGYRCIAHVTYTIAASDGSTATARMVGEAIDYGDKSTSKAIQMAYKYMLTELLAVGSGSEDPDAHSPDLDRGRVLSAEEIGQRATNKLKADVIALVGDRERARILYADIVSNYGYGPEDVIPEEAHQAVLEAVGLAAAETAEVVEPRELTAEERPELEAAIAAKTQAEEPFELQAEEGAE